MKLTSWQNSLFIFLGDLIALALSLWLTLFIRFQAVPTEKMLIDHLVPFSIIFVVWALTYFIYDLYGATTLFIERKLVIAVLNAQLINTILAVVFFYFIPYFGITPKTTLFIFLIISFAMVLTWRRFGVLSLFRRRPTSVLFACGGDAAHDLIDHLRANNTYGISVRNGDINIANPNVSMIVFNSYDSRSAPLFSSFYKLLFGGISFVSLEDMYEEVFSRVPVSIISERWFLEHISSHPKPFYNFSKRLTDVVVAVLAGIVSLAFYPLVILLIKLEDNGPIFIYQTRVGKNNRPITLIKFRTMTSNDNGVYGASQNNTGKNKVTRVGKFLRKTRIDELPQLWNVLRGDVSLIGPRPELVDLVKKYEAQIPYYNMRHMIQPGLSGWAQIYHEQHPHHGVEVTETRNKLSYDLYYVKHRGAWLDLAIALKTIGILLSVKGS